MEGSARASRPHIQLDYRVGHLTVEASTEERKNGYVIWRCRCDCGREICLDTRCLQRGRVRDCGCRTVVSPGRSDLTGQRFGRLTALYPTGETNASGSVIWHLRCDCGGEVDASQGQLVSGKRKSCGCLRYPPLKDFVGRRFGRLTVTAYAGKEAGMHRWRCRCDCGQETVVGQTLLQRGKTTSCGCRQKQMYLENLKLVDGTSVTLLEAGRKHIISSNTSGYTGVYQHKRSGKWEAQITFKGRTYYLGLYEEIEEAVAARKKGEEMRENFLQWYYETALPDGEKHTRINEG